MTQNLNCPVFDFLVHKVIGGTNMCEFKWFKVMVDAERMSGEMNTSLGNGFTNLMLLFAVHVFLGVSIDEVFELIDAIIEGDDALFRMICDRISAKIYRKFGFTIDLKIHDNINTASFCGMVYDVEDKRNVRDPIPYINDMFWFPRQYIQSSDNKLKSLLRCKALSGLYQYAGCPMIYPLCKRLVVLTEGIKEDDGIMKSDIYKYERYLMNKAYCDKHPEIFNMTIGDNTRYMLEKLYNISIQDQLGFESWVTTMQFGDSLPDIFYSLSSEDAKDFYDRFSVIANVNSYPDLHHCNVTKTINYDAQSAETWLTRYAIDIKQMNGLWSLIR